MSRQLRQLLLIVLVLGTPVFATTVRKMELPELVSLADSIVQGHVESVQARWEDKSIYTYTSIAVDDPLKGERRRSLLVRQPGGTVGALSLSVPGIPHFRTGDQVIVFLRNRQDGTFDVVGLSQGKYDLLNDFAVTNITGLTLVDPKTGQLMEAGSVDKTPLEGFKRKIRELAR